MINIHFTVSYIEIYLIFINIFSFFFYGFDKLQAIKNDKNISRVSERALLFTSLIGGSLGALCSMFLFRHKIRKLPFIVKFIVVVLIQMLVIYFKSDIYEVLNFF